MAAGVWGFWEKGVPLGRIFGIPIRLHVLFLALLGVQVAVAATRSKYLALFWFLLLGPMLLATVLIHELGHCLAAKSVGSSVHGILLWPLGGLAFIGQTGGPKADLWVAAAGPLTHIPQVLLYVLCLLPVHKKNFGDTHISLRIPSPRHYMGEAILVGALLMNIAMFAFNLLVPAYPLDGGRILVDLLLMCGVRPVPTAWVSIVLSSLLSLGIIIYGGLKFQIVLLLIGLWIMFSAVQLYDTVRKGEVHNHPLFADVCNNAPASNTHQQQAPAPNYV